MLALGAGALLLSGCQHVGDGSPAPSAALSPLSASVPASSSPIRFVDVAEKAGLQYQWTIPGKRPVNILQTIGNGGAFLDYNNDGKLDILLVGSRLALYQGLGQGRFADVTHSVGLDTLKGHFIGCAVGDFDNDGFEDVYVTAYQGGVLLHNDHGARLVDITRSAGIAPQPWGTSAIFVDINNDGKLDLYVGNYVQFGPSQPQLCPDNGEMVSCSPNFYSPLKGALYLNNGSKFTDATRAWNALNISGKTLGIAAANFDGSGRQSILLANDEVAGNLLANDGKRFTDIGVANGTAYGANGEVYGGMGADWGDYDGDGLLDLFVSTYRNQVKQIYRQDAGHGFTDRSVSLGVAAPTRPYVAFGVKWLDADNDGWLDLMIANGHVVDNIARVDHDATFREPTQFLHNEGGKRFVDESASALTGDAGKPILGRGLATGDYDDDGKVDALVIDSDGKPLLLHNETPQTGHWLEIRLIGTHSNRDGIGALVTVAAGGRPLLRACTTGGSYLSASDRRIHVGMGSATTAETISILWPDGHKDIYRNVAADHIATLKEGDATPALAG